MKNFALRQNARRELRFTTEGKIFVVLTFATGLAALNTNNNLLYLILCIMLAMIIISGIFSELAIVKLNISRELPHRVFAEETFFVKLNVTNTRRLLPSIAVELRDTINGKPFLRSCFFLRIDAGESRTIEYRCAIKNRGISNFEAIEISTGFPFGFFRKSRRLILKDDLLVWPRKKDSPLPTPQTGLDSLQAAIGAQGHGEEFWQLKEFGLSDDPRYIYWKATARYGRKIIRETLQNNGRAIQLILHAADGDHTTEENELKISITAGLIETLCQHGYAVELITHQTISVSCRPTGSAAPLLDHLATLSTDPESIAHIPTPTIAAYHIISPLHFKQAV